MNIALWVVAAVLAALFLAAGTMKLMTPKAKLLTNERMGWAADFSEPVIKLIGALEVAGAVGMIVPPLVKIAPVLAPLAATGLALMMIGAAVAHARRRESVVVQVVLFALAAFVAWGRFAAVPFV